MTATVAVRAPAAWLETSAPPPPLPDGIHASVTDARGWQSPARDETLVVTCVKTPVPGWVEDMRPSVNGRTLILVKAAAEKVGGVAVDARPLDDHFMLDASGQAGPPRPVGTARTFLGFEGDHVVSCFVACVASGSATRERACDSAVVRATFEPGTAPPPGFALHAVTWGVHHPVGSAAFFAVLATTLGIFAVVARRRPRSRI